MSKPNTRIAIIGAGISGLAAGTKLLKAGFDPVLFERESFVGGRMSSKNLDGFIIDKGAYTIPESHKNLRRFIKEMDMKGSFVVTPGTYSTFNAGKEYKTKIGSIRRFLKSELFSPKSKKEIIRLFWYSRRLGSALNLAKPRKKTFLLEEESAAEFLLNNYDKQVLEYIAYPLFCEMFLGTPENNSKPAFLASLKNLYRLKIFSLKEGMGTLPERLARPLDVRLSSPVIGIHSSGRQGPFEIQIGGEKPAALVFDAVIFALPSPIVPQLYPELPESLKACFQNTLYTPSIVIALAVDHEYPETSMINSLLRKDFRVLGNIIYDHHKGPFRVPQGRGLITAILCEQASRKLFDKSDDIIINEVLKEMDILYHGFSSKLIFSRVYRWEYGAVQLRPGFLSVQDKARKELEDKLNNFYIAGDGLFWSGLEVSFNTGVEAAKRVIKKMAKG
jgi:oxygen-dependent protoporphyrinogen oxidase